jgi:hypothetical protein
MMSICIFFTVTFFVEINRQYFFSFRFLIPGWYLRASHLLHMIISKQDIHIYYLFHIYLTITLSSVLKQKSSFSTRDKCVYLLEASETSIPSEVKNTSKIAIFRMCYREKGTVKFLETLADNVFRHNFNDANKKKNYVKMLGLPRSTYTLNI